MVRCLPLAVWLISASALAGPDAILRVENAPGVSCGLPLSVRCSAEDLAHLAGPDARTPLAATATLSGGGEKARLPVAVEKDRLWLVLPAGAKGSLEVSLDFHGPVVSDAASKGLAAAEPGGAVTVANEHFTIVHDPRKMGGLPSRVGFKGGRTTESFAFNDRLHDPTLGGFSLRSDPKPAVKIICSMPAMAIVEVAARYMQGDKPAPTGARATYRFTYFAASPIVRVEADVSQDAAQAWNELHFLEVNFADDFFKTWACGEPRAEGSLKADKTSRSGEAWAALADGDHAIGLLNAGEVKIYDGRGQYGTYLHGPWLRWETTAWHGAADLWIGRTEHPAEAIAQVAATARPRAYLTTPAAETQRADCRRTLDSLPPGPRRGRLRWLLELGHRLAEAEGRLAESDEVIGLAGAALAEDLSFEKALKRLPKPLADRWTLLQNDAVGVLLDRRPDHLAVGSLFDFASERELLAAFGAPLWALQTQLADKTALRLDSAAGWRDCKVTGGGAKAEMAWRKPADGRLADVAVSVSVVLEGPRTRWAMKVENAGKSVALREITCPGLALALRDDDTVISPLVSGRLHSKPLSRRLTFSSEYPSSGLAMQCIGFSGPRGGTYVGLHDPYGSTKSLHCTTADGHLAVAWKWPAPNAGVPGTSWAQSGELVVQPFMGDWFDFALLYRQWAEAEAAWWPAKEQRGRPDTPDWMKDIAVWTCTGGRAQDVVRPVTHFAKYLEVPVAVHWYNWHQIPFDDDYPHYFPAKDGFAEGVKELQAAGVRVMPYINGRLWDTDLEDFKTDGIKAATKDESGQPYIEQYGSGQKLAPMCPTTRLWRKTVTDTVLRLLGPECNVDGVYIDQVAAASPRLCFDPSHGHPLGGGCWWTKDGYWPMLRDLRAKIAADRPGKMITTECNAEPYVNLFDGYLTWHFQDDGAIPLFAAIYGGQVQLFSRAYQGDSWKGAAMRQKTAQALVFGEQLGWMGPQVIDDPVAGPFLKQLGKFRYALRDYLARGRMARPPRVKDDGARVTANWRWYGDKEVTTPAVLSGAWQAGGGGVALVLVNVDEKEHAGDLDFRGADYGFAAKTPGLTLRTRTGLETPADPERVGLNWNRRVTLKPCTAVAFEVQAEGSRAGN